jgi:hypothetical protein
MDNATLLLLAIWALTALTYFDLRSLRKKIESYEK